MYKGEYQLVGSEMSFFTRKLEAQLRFQGIEWRWQFKTEERKAALEARAGTHFVPLLITPDKWILNDTIAIGPLLNDRFPQRSVIPESPRQRACCFILEDAFNHWLGRVCIHSRWCYADNVSWVGPRFGANSLLNRSIEVPFTPEELEEMATIGPMILEGFGRNACEYNGVGPDQADAVQGDYQNMLDALAAHLSLHNFLLGNRPCLADFALAGACKAHFLCDPTPVSWLGKYRDMLVDYTERFYREWPDEPQDWESADQVPDTLVSILEYLQGTYFQFASANISAGLAGEKYYEYDYGSGPTRARTQKRLNGARLHVQDELQRLGAKTNDDVQTFFAGRGILEYYLS
jgi:glutathione S-transferase